MVTRKPHNYLLSLPVIGVTLLLIFLTVVSVNYTNRMVSEYSTLVETSIEVKQELSVAHLWFEEVISGDSNETIKQVWMHLDKSDQHALNVLAGDFSSTGENTIINNLGVRSDIENIRKEIAVFRALTAERFDSIKYAGVGSDIDQKYDAVFLNIIRQVDNVTEKLKVMRGRDLERFNLMQNVLILLIIGAGVLVIYLLYRYQSRLIEAINKQLDINQELNKSNIRFHDIALCGGDWIWEVDKETRYTFVSDNVKNIIGYSADEVLGRTPFDFMHEDEASHVRDLFSKIILNEEKIVDLDNWNLGKDGKAICLRTNGVPVFDEDGKLKGYRGVDKDVTDQLLMNERLIRNQKMDALGKLTGGIAHDFNNILGTIIGYSDLLKESVSDDLKSNKYIDSIIHASDRAKNLTSKLLAFSSKEASSVSKLDINKLLRDDQHMLEATLTARVSLFYELEVDLWPVELEVGALEGAILNIVINAMHAIRDTGSLVITTSNVHISDKEAKLLHMSDGDYVTLSFSDTGIGMDKITLQKIFDPFFTTKGDDGTGLGLTQVYGFVQRSKGSIQVSSQTDKGATIIIYLPKCDTTKSINVKQNIDNDREMLLTGSETILVVDDNDESRDMVAKVLSKNGYRVLCAKNAIKALIILESTPVDLLFSDVIMPIMGGYELAAKVKKLYPAIKVQLTSGYTDMEHVSKVDENLHLKHLSKPYTITSLLICIRGLLDNA